MFKMLLSLRAVGEAISIQIASAAFGILAMTIILAAPVFAEDISVEASVDSTTIELGASLRLTVTINGVDTAPPLQLPKIDGLEIRYLGPSTKISLINGKMSRSTGLMFTVIPLKTGQFQIPAITIPLAGKNYTTQPISISVVDPGKLPASQGAADNSSAALQDKIFIILATSKKEAYVNEPIPTTIKLFIGDLAVKNVQFPALPQEGFTAEPFVESGRGQQVLGGISYQVIEFKTFIYPTRVGELSLGPAKLGANIMIQSSRRQDIPGDFGHIFSDDILDEFLGRYSIKTIILESADIGIKVFPLPEEEKPSGFSGGVGKYNFNITASPVEVKVGDPITVRMKVAGDGNLKSLELPAFKDSEDFKVYDPKIVEQNGEKTLEQVVIPKNEQVKELPAVDFSYFDTDEKKYFTITKGPFPLVVNPLAKGEEAKVVGVASQQSAPVIISQPEELGQDIHFIKENIGSLQKKGYVLSRDVAFIAALVLFVLSWLGLFANYLFRQRLSTDHRLARRLLAPRQAKAGLAQAAAYLAKDDARNFCDNLIKTLQEYFGNKFHVPQNTVTVAVIAMNMKDPNSKIIDDLSQIFNECELVRFASAPMPAEKMKAVYQRSQEIIDHFERNVK